MTEEEFRLYKERVEAQKEELLTLLARVTLAEEYDIEIDLDGEGPLADLFGAIKIAAENLELTANQLEERVTQAEQISALVSEQNATIRELSTPVIQVWDDILVLPLVGTIDNHRAQQVMENLLQEVIRYRASVVIIDVTGVPEVDTAVAGHLTVTVNAAQMLGAKVIMTGMGAETARNLARLGVNMGVFAAKASLQGGLETAFDLTGREVASQR